MLGTPFNHDIIRKCVIAFGTLFNNIKIQRSDDTWISVPITYSSKEKWYARLTDPDLAQQVQSTLPRIGYDLVAMNYAAERKLGTMNKYSTINTSDTTGNTKQMMYEGTPYDLSFELAIYGRNAADCSKIIEQILPFFTPEFTLTLNNVTEHNIDVDIPIRFDAITREDAYEGDFESTRTLIWTLNFTMKSMLFGPVTSPKIVKKAYVDFFIPEGTSIDESTLSTIPTSSRIYFQPGLTAGGEPTTDISQSVALDSIDVDDTWGYAANTTHPTDGTRRNLTTGNDEDL